MVSLRNGLMAGGTKEIQKMKSGTKWGQLGRKEMTSYMTLRMFGIYSKGDWNPVDGLSRGMTWYDLGLHGEEL